jgi:phosphoribosylanthranilate isomerase
LKIKICGLTRPEDVALACSLGADACGFVLAPSPRQVSLESLPGLQSALVSTALSVAVMVDPEPAEVAQALAVVDRVQLHGTESPAFCRRYGRRVWKAFRIRSPEDLDALDAYVGCAGAFVLDSFRQGLAGGTGQAFPWDYLEGREIGAMSFLAGGLSPANVAEACRVSSVGGLDVSSGVESSPGVKDPEKLRAFFEAVRREMTIRPVEQGGEAWRH